MSAPRSYTLGQARPVNFQSKTLVGTDSVTRAWTDKIKITNHGKKRTAILGWSWNINGIENEVPLAAHVYWDHYLIGYDSSEINRKNTGRLVLQRVSSYWFMAAAGGNTEPYPLPNDMNGMTRFPEPMLIKKGYIEIGIALSSNWAASNIVGRWTVWLADAYLLEDTGDFYESTRLNRGWRRCKRIGQTRIVPSKKQGWV